MAKSVLKLELLVAVVNSGKSNYVINSALQAGAHGATLITGRGMGEKESNKFFGITFHQEKECVFIVCPKKQKNKIMTAICTQLKLTNEGNGICFSMPIENFVGYNFKDPEIET